MSDLRDPWQRLRNAAYVMFNDGYRSKTLAKDAANEIEHLKHIRDIQHEQIVTLRAALADARDEALESAAKVAEATHEDAPEDEQLGDEYWSLRVSCNTRSARIARAIRSLKEGKT